MKDSIIFFSGKFIPETEVYISPRTHALHYGTACFEGIRSYYSSKENVHLAFKLQEHYQRLLLSAKILFLSIPYTLDELCDITTKLIKKNYTQSDMYIRPLLYKSDPAVGNFNLKTLQTSFLIYITSLKFLDSEKGIRVNTSSWVRVNDNSIPPRGKISGAYVNTALAKTESLLNGYDEAILLDHEGHVTEGSAANIFIVRNNAVITPPVTSDILEGITRNVVKEICQDKLKIHVSERNIDRTELYQADEAFFVGTGAEIAPIVEVDKRMVGDGKVGSLTQKIKNHYYLLTHGEYPKYSSYITKVSEGI